MNNKNIHLYVIGDGDPELQSMIERGLMKLGKNCTQTFVTTGCTTLLDGLSGNELPIIIKPYNEG